MKKFLYTVAVVSLSASLARATISDNGNMNLGGNAVVGGTMTVQGNAFSVGGSTLAIVGGNVGIGTVGPMASLDVEGSSPTVFDVNVGSFSVNNLGYITSKTQPAAIAVASVSQAFPNNHFGEVFFSTDIYNNVGASMHSMTASSGTFTAPSTGLYYFECYIRDNNTTSGTYNQITIEKNGAVLTYGVSAPASSANGFQDFSQVFINANANDTFQCWFQQGSGVTISVVGTGDMTGSFAELIKVW